MASDSFSITEEPRPVSIFAPPSPRALEHLRRERQEPREEFKEIRNRFIQISPAGLVQLPSLSSSFCYITPADYGYFVLADEAGFVSAAQSYATVIEGLRQDHIYPGIARAYCTQLDPFQHPVVARAEAAWSAWLGEARTRRETAQRGPRDPAVSAAKFNDLFGDI